MKYCLKLWAVGLLGLWAALAQAQVPDRVGRLAYLAGEVQFYADATGAWEPAQLNGPLTSHNSLFTGAGSRAEMRFGSTAVALDSQTQLNILHLDDGIFRANLGQGSISLRPRHLERDEALEVTAPGATYRLLQDGRYRVDGGEGGSSVTVFAGAAQAVLPGGTVLVEAGKSLSASGGGYLLLPARSSALDRWAQQRDEAYRPGVATRYVSPDMTGYEELDANGRWDNDPDYGMVWFPTTYVPLGWAPYRYGRWAYVLPWGWTWIDNAPWGFAPFHYGRWVRVGRGWAWTPGRYVAHPSYAPALVVFVGIAGGAPTARGLPSVGWYPLPPWERYRPVYAHRAATLHNLNNFTGTSPPPRAWSQAGSGTVTSNQLHGTTVVPQGDFVASRPVARSLLPVPASALPAAAPVAAPAPPPLRPRPADAAPARGSAPGATEPGRRPPESGGIQSLPPPRPAPSPGPLPEAGTSLGRDAPAAALPGPRVPSGPGVPSGRGGGNRPRNEEAPRPLPPPATPPVGAEQRRLPSVSAPERGAPGVFAAPGMGAPPPPLRPRPEAAPLPGPPRSDSLPAARPALPSAPPAAPVLERPAPSPRQGGFREGGGAPLPPSPPAAGALPHPAVVPLPAPRPEPGREIGQERGQERGREWGNDVAPRPRGGEAGDAPPPRESRGGGERRRFGGPER